MVSISEKLLQRFPGRVRQEECMANHTTMHTGGPAALWVKLTDKQEAADGITLLREAGQRFVLLGNGSNILFPDDGYAGTVLQWQGEGTCMHREGHCLLADGGESLMRLAVYAREEGLAGLAWASGIPGSLGAAVSINAGAYGGEMGQLVQWAEILDKAGDIRRIPGEALEFAYRSSRIQREGWIVLSACLQLLPGDPAAIGNEMRELAEKRRSKQPLTLPSCGSAFKRPVNGYAAALIEQAGCKGWQEGGAQVSTLHAGFIVNTGGATTGDVLRLMERVRQRVLDFSGITLTPEIQTAEEAEAWYN